VYEEMGRGLSGGSRQGQGGNCFRQVNESPVSVKRGEYLNKLKNQWNFEKDPRN